MSNTLDRGRPANRNAEAQISAARNGSRMLDLITGTVRVGVTAPVLVVSTMWPRPPNPS
jgi:hypothetical protein